MGKKPIHFVIKTLVTALIVAGISELARRYPLWAALLASLPLTSILAFVWIYSENKDTQKIIDMSYSILWLVIPSLLFFIIFPGMLKTGVKFTPALFLSCLIMALAYSGALRLYTFLK